MDINDFTQNSSPYAAVQIPNYQIVETVYSGGRTLVYRAIRIRDQLPVIIKLLKNDYPTFSELMIFTPSDPASATMASIILYIPPIG